MAALPHPADPRVARCTGDAGDIVVSWLLRVALVLTLLGVVAFDTIAVSAARLSVQDDSQAAAYAAATTWVGSHDIRRAYASAQSVAVERDTYNVVDRASFEVDAQGRAHVTVTRRARTVVLEHLGPLRRWTAVRGVGVGGVPSL